MIVVEVSLGNNAIEGNLKIGSTSKLALMSVSLIKVLMGSNIVQVLASIKLWRESFVIATTPVPHVLTFFSAGRRQSHVTLVTIM